ncbi:hypothetical protein GE061_013292 [Apolygus lucorum]|uniref:Uncharacterized protein n=1 Tax=Apolygus lucorum TaxID=248454 RepID=A0A8S9XME5_APOLU|nr:hypothetical protein GE061_013292 [Apolygus lucorum]
MRQLWYTLLRNETTTQIVKKLYEDFFKVMTLPSDSDVLSFGHLVQLRSPCLTAYNGQRGLVLSITLSEGDIEVCPLPIRGTYVTASPQKDPCVRNTFQILPVDPATSGDTVKTNDRFLLRTVGCGNSSPLYVEAEPTRWGDPQHPANLPVIRLTSRLTNYCWWYASQRRQRGDPPPKEGVPIKVREDLVIRLAMNNQTLTVEKDRLYGTFFGNEYGVTIHNRNGRIDLVYPESIWEFVTGSS